MTIVYSVQENLYTRAIICENEVTPINQTTPFNL